MFGLSECNCANLRLSATGLSEVLVNLPVTRKNLDTSESESPAESESGESSESESLPVVPLAA